MDRLTSWTLNGTPETYSYDSTTGNLQTKGSRTLSYGTDALGAPAPSGCSNESSPRKIAHSASSAGTGNLYSYDCNGNMIYHKVGTDEFALRYDAENRLTKVCRDANQNAVCDTGETEVASFVYDGDGNQVKSTIGALTTTFVCNYYEVAGTQVNKYYYAGGSTWL